MNSDLIASVEKYLLRFPGERKEKHRIIRQMASSEPLDIRSNMTGHLSASVFLLSCDDSKVFLVKNKSLDLWVLPGGHVDPGETPLIAAKREVIEETGYANFDFTSPEPIDLDTHEIPPRAAKGESAHWHHDFRFVAKLAEMRPARLQQEEVSESLWLPIKSVTPASVAPSLRRAFAKLLAGEHLAHGR